MKQIFLIGAVFAAAVYLVRLLPLDFGVHFILLTIILAIMLTMYFKINFSRCLLIALLVGIILAVSETVFMYLFSLYAGITMDQLPLGYTTHIMFAWPHIIFIFLLALAINHWRKVRL